MLERAKRWAGNVRRDALALWIAARDPRTPLVARIVAGAVAAYALSPIDLIPDFIPVIGYLDDLVIVPLGILLAVRLIPKGLMETFRAEATTRIAQAGRGGAVFVVVLWLLAGAGLLWFFWPPGLR